MDWYNAQHSSLNGLGARLTHQDSNLLIGSGDVHIVLADFGDLALRLTIPLETRNTALRHVCCYNWLSRMSLF